jgi:hypothetical protein
MAKTDVRSVRFTSEDRELIRTIADGRPIGQVIRACVIAILTELQRQQTSHREEPAEFDTMMTQSEPARLVLDRQHANNPDTNLLGTIRSLIDDITQDEFTTPPPDLTITTHRENGRWWSEHPPRSWYAGADTFDQLTERLAEGLHLLGLNQERPTITWTKLPTSINLGPDNTATPKRLTFAVPEGE